MSTVDIAMLVFGAGLIALLGPILHEAWTGDCPPTIG